MRSALIIVVARIPTQGFYCKTLKTNNNLKNNPNFYGKNAKKFLKPPISCPERKSGFLYQETFSFFFLGHFGLP